MSKKLQFIWVDDDPGREQESKNIEKLLGVKVRFINVEKQDLYRKIEEIVSGNEPDLIIMDHRLQNVESELIKTGSTVAEILREKWTNCPIVCITGVEIEEVDLHRQAIYEDVFPVSNISKYYSTLLSIAKSFKKIKTKVPENVEQLLSLLRSPKEDKERLAAILPDNLKKNIRDPSFPLFFSKWARKTLIAKPGFLFDKLWASTLIGIKEESFVKVEKLFSKAKYNGIFSDECNERWWQSSLRKTLSSLVDDPKVILPWEQGRKLPGISKEDYSKCYVSGEAFPETVAFVDDTAAAKRAPMKLKYTIPHPQFKNALFFEEIRMMKAEE